MMWPTSPPQKKQTKKKNMVYYVIKVRLSWRMKGKEKKETGYKNEE